MRETLTELLMTPIECDSYDCITCEYSLGDEKCQRHISERTADHLLANGVIVPLVFVVSTVYYIYDLLGEICIKEMRVVECTFDEQGLYLLEAEDFDRHMSILFTRNHTFHSFETLRFSKEEAEKAVAEFSNENDLHSRW